MRIEIEHVSPVKKKLSIEADPEEVRHETEDAVRRVAREVRLPGFRPGKVPLDVVRSRFAKEVRSDVRDRLISRLFHEAVREHGLKPVGDPVLDDVSSEAEDGLRFRATLECLPELEPKGYRGIEVRETVAKVDDAHVERMLASLQESQAKLIAEEGRVAATGDVVIADVKGEPEGGEAFSRERILIEVGSTDNLPEFNERIAGARSGDELDFPVRYPAEYGAKELAGKTVRYRVDVHDVKRRELPALDDEFAKDIGDFDSLDALKARIRSDLEERARVEARRDVKQSILDKVLLENPVPLPEALVEDEIRHRLEDTVRAMMMRGIDPRSEELDWETLRNRHREGAQKTVHSRILLDAVAQAESIEVERREVDARIAEEARRIGEKPEALRKRLSEGSGIEAFANQLVREKALDFLTSVANISREDLS